EMSRFMSSRIRIVKRQEREAKISRATEDSPPAESQTSAIVKTVKNWIATTRERREAEMLHALSFRRSQKEDIEIRPFTLAVAAPTAVPARAKGYLTIALTMGLMFFAAQGWAAAQVSATASSDSLTLDQAIDIALRNNHGVKIAGLGVEKAG